MLNSGIEWQPEQGDEPLIVLVDTEHCFDEAAVAAALGGASVVHFRTAAAFLEHMPRGDANCIVAAANLPDMSGVEFIRTLRASDDHTPVILMAKDCGVHTAVAAVKAGACDCVERPLRPEALLDRVREVLQQGS